ncbi:ubiquitin-like domain-containing protein [Jeotgalibacillus sp. ET6]|uniref:G5 and 3D domain-containing protein n=1 Tax=Jeotgalibacillus sp. ET6 TaxID=3037260 RepID=UPI0024185FFD|nr:G5 and 3D domain-containing protein [Jeotgalibacillus sp. ET6]MDG5473840.1 ubiquitin-like domain-containing protein [Jeotgalibacillus sp. ET6]
MQSNNVKNLNQRSVNKRNWVYSLITITVFVLAVTFFFQEGMKKTVSLSVNGEEQLVRTNADHVKDIFAELEIEVDSKDYLNPSGDSAVYHDMKVKWEAAKEVSLTISGQTWQVKTTADTIKEFLDKENIQVNEKDSLSHELTADIEEDMAITLEQAFAWTLVDGTKEQEAWSTSITVADFLKQHDIKLDKDDRIEPALDTKLSQGASVKIVRVEKVTDVVEESKNFAVETREDSDLTSGAEEVVQKGEKGLVEKTYDIVLENGKEVSRKLASEKVVKESINQVVSIGTKTVVAEVPRETEAVQASSEKTESASQPVQTVATAASAPAATTTAVQAVNTSTDEPEGGKELTVSSTAYTASCNGCSGITATGIDLKANPGMKVIAVDPSVIPLGSKVYVEGYGLAVAGDTGGAIKGNKIDVFIPSKEEAYRWGNRQVKITILP